jgi:hypothetical protein
MTITPQNVQRLKALGGGLALHGFRYLAGTPPLPARLTG